MVSQSGMIAVFSLNFARPFFVPPRLPRQTVICITLLSPLAKMQGLSVCGSLMSHAETCNTLLNENNDQRPNVLS